MKLIERRLRREYRLINKFSDDGDARVSGQTAACELYIYIGEFANTHDQGDVSTSSSTANLSRLRIVT